MEAATHTAARRVQRIDATRVAALLNQDLVPALPARVLGLKRYAPADPAPPNILAAIAWFCTGDPFRPTGLIGLEPRYDKFYGRWCLEVQELRGSVWDIRALMFCARDLAAVNGWVLTGEFDASNTEMRRLMRSIFKGEASRPDRIRYSMEP